MKHRISLIIIILIAILAVSCKPNSKEQVPHNEVVQDTKNHIEVLYFHSAKRCITCRAIEKHTVDLLDSLYKKELESGDIVYRIIDISKDENQATANHFEIAWSSLLLVDYHNGTETVHNMTEHSFATAKNSSSKFKQGIIEEINSIIKLHKAGESPSN